MTLLDKQTERFTCLWTNSNENICFLDIGASESQKRMGQGIWKTKCAEAGENRE